MSKLAAGEVAQREDGLHGGDPGPGDENPMRHEHSVRAHRRRATSGRPRLRSRENYGSRPAGRADGGAGRRRTVAEVETFAAALSRDLVDPADFAV